MKRRTLGRSGLEVSVVGFGGIPIQGVSFDEAERIVHAALDAGIDFIDSARGYTDSEQKIGRALAGRRDRVTLASKAMSRDAAGMTAELEASLRDLGTDHLDLYQLHALGSAEQLAQVLGPDGAWTALDRARRAGKVRCIGVTGHSRPVLEQAVASGAFDTVQLPFNPLETDWLGDVIPAARAHDVGIIGMKPVAGGALAGLALPSLRFALDRGVDVVIPGFDKARQVAENAAAGTDFRAPDAAELAAFEREKERWRGHFCRRCGYCKPCPNGLEIPLLLLIEAYYTRYELRDWALARLAPLEQQYADCAACGECVERCPYDLPVPDLMAAAAKVVR